MLEQQTINELWAAFCIGMGNVFWMWALLREWKSVPRKARLPVRSGAWATCEHCKYEGYVYGTAHSNGVSAPWCPQCGLNNQLRSSNEHQTRI